MGGDYALKLSWGPRMCALRQSFYEAPGICLGEESLIKETQQPFMFFILGGYESASSSHFFVKVSVQPCRGFSSSRL